ncbi:MAG: hypothetical protein MZV64_58290 [Ignavibacteriales bacterium]|nr:hypothetical protein [Ignavibacteriales bacterium]
MTSVIFGQPPQKLSYRGKSSANPLGALVANQTVGMKISILQGSVTGTAVYVETQTKLTDANGLVTIEIGGGTPVTGTFAGITWKTNIFFIKTETDPKGGTNYSITGTGQILSVPYALYAASAPPRPMLMQSVQGHLIRFIIQHTMILLKKDGWIIQQELIFLQEPRLTPGIIRK